MQFLKDVPVELVPASNERASQSFGRDESEFSTEPDKWDNTATESKRNSQKMLRKS